MSDCDVCIGGECDYDGLPEFQKVEMRTARKDHKCFECRQVIPNGQRYEAFTCKFDGAVETTKTCEACADIRSVYSCGEATPAFGDMWNAFHDTDAFSHMKMAGECWDKLSAPAKAKLLERWREWKGL